MSVSSSATNWTIQSSYPTFGWIITGHQSVEARPSEGDWKKIKEGDTITFIEMNAKKRIIHQAVVVVTKRHKYDTIGELYSKFGRKYLPNSSSLEEAEKFFKTNHPTKKSKIIGLEFQIYSYQNLNKPTNIKKQKTTASAKSAESAESV